MHFASQTKLNLSPGSCGKKKTRVGGLFFFFTIVLLLFCFSAKTSWVLRFFPLRLKGVKADSGCKCSERAERCSNSCLKPVSRRADPRVEMEVLSENIGLIYMLSRSSIDFQHLCVSLPPQPLSSERSKLSIPS